MADPTKRIEANIDWQVDLGHAPTMKFRVPVQCQRCHGLILAGSFNPAIPALSFTIFLESVGRIYGLDMGKNHRNPDGRRIGTKHKHRWTQMFKDTEAYSPIDITCAADQPASVWPQFCKEAKLVHEGTMSLPGVA